VTTAFHIWTAGREEADALARLEALAFGGKSWGADSVKESFVASRVTVLFGGESASEAQGFAVWRDIGDEAELLTIGVEPSARRRGLGAALVRAVIDAAREAHVRRFYLEVAADNAIARALYERAGFAEVGVRKAYYKDGGDAAVLALDL
jgi:[ribosomal protein S18]-alanine N-acetyltransferase